MSIMTLRMLIIPALALAVAATLSPARAQVAEAAPGGAEEGAQRDPLDLPPDASRDERLDALFAALAVAEEPAADKIANRISGLWAQSGSASMDLLLARARKATKADKLDRARAHVRALVRLAPEFAEGWNASATLHFAEEDYWQAVEDIQRVLALEPRHFGALSGLALILEHVDRKAAALTAWREIVSIFPGMKRAQEAVKRLEKDVDGDRI